MAALRLMGKWGVPLATAISVPIFSPSVFADSGSKDSAKPASRMVRPSELPIYEEPEEVLDFEYHGRERTSLEEGVGVVRKEIEGVVEATRSTREKIVHICETGKAHTMATVDYITDEDNIIPRAGAITIGGLAGLVLGARKKGGLVKKVLYTSTGIAATASLCYPRQAYQISQQVYGNVKDYANIGYNFVAGVKPQSKKEAPVEPKEPTVEQSSEAEAPPSTESTAAPEAALATSEPEGEEVRSVLPQALPDEKLPAPLDSLAQQSSDVMQWGFRLTDKTSNASSVCADVVSPTEPTVPEGFGSVSEADNKDVLEAAADHVIVEEPVKEAAGSETIMIPKAVESLAADVAEKVAEDILEKAGEELVEKAAEVVSEVAQETEEEAKEVAEVAKVVEEVSEKGASVVDVVKDVVEAADKAAHETPGMSETALDVAKEIVEDVEKVVDTVKVIAEKVEEVAEEIAKEAEEIRTKALELVESEEKGEEFIEKVIDYVKEELETEAVEKVVDTVTDITEKVEEVATKVLELAESEEKREELIEKVIDYVKEELVPETVQEVTEAVEAHVKEMADVKTEEGAVETEPELEIKEIAVEQEPKIEEKVDAVTAALEDKEVLPTTETVDTHLEEPSPVTEIGEVKETPAAEVIEPKAEYDAQVPVRKEGLFDKLISLFTKDEEIVSKTSAPPEEATYDKVEVPETEGMKVEAADVKLNVEGAVEEAVLPVIEKVAEDIAVKVGDEAVEKTAEIVDELSKEVEQETEVVAETAETVKEVGDEVASALKVADEVAEAAAEAAQAVPDLPEIIKEKAEMAKEVVEEAEKLVDTITVVAEKVKDVADEVKQEAVAIEAKATELIESEEKREEFIEEVVDFVVEKLKGEFSLTDHKVDMPKQEPEPVEKSEDISVGETTEVVQDTVEEKEPEQPSIMESQDPTAEGEITVKVTETAEEEIKEPQAEKLKPELKEGLVDKLINLLIKSEDKVLAPAAVEEKAETVAVETVTPEVPIVVQEHVEEKEPEQVVVEDSKEVLPEIPVVEELQEATEPVKEVKGQVAEELEAPVLVAETVEEVKPKEKEGLVDKLISLFSKTDEKELTPAVAEEKSETLDKETVTPKVPVVVQEHIEEKEPEQVVVEESKAVPSEVPVIEELKEVPAPVEEEKEQATEELQAPVSMPEPISKPIEKEGLVDKLINLFSKTEDKAELGEGVKAVTSDVTIGAALEEVHEMKQELVIPEAIKEVQLEGETLEDVPVAEELKEVAEELVEHMVEKLRDAAEQVGEELKEVAEKLVEEAKDVADEALEPVAEELTKVAEIVEEVKDVVSEELKEKISEEKEGLVDKLVSLFSRGEEKEVAPVVAEEEKAESSMVQEELKVEELVEEVKDAADKALEQVAEELTEVAEKLVEHAVEEVKDVADKLLEPVTEELKEVAEELVEEVKDAADKLLEPLAEELKEKEGLVDKLVSLFSKSEEKEVAPVAAEEEKAEPAVKDAADKALEQVAEELTEVAEKLAEHVVEEVKDAADKLLEPVTEELKEVAEDLVEEVKDAADKLLEPLAEELKEKEGLVDKLVRLFSKSEEKEVAPVAAEEEKAEPSVKPEEVIQDVSTVGTETTAEELKPDSPLVEEVKEEPIESKISVEIPSPATSEEQIVEEIKESSSAEVKDSSSEKVEESSVEDVQEPKPEITSEEKEGLIDKLVSLFSKSDEEKDSKVVVEEKADIGEPADVIQEISEEKAPDIPLAEETKEVPLESEATVEVPVSEELKEPAATVIEETLPGVQEASIKEDKVGLFDKLAKMFSSDDKDAVPVKEEAVAKPDATELKERSEESVATEDLVIVEKEEVPLDTKEVTTDESLEMEDFVIVEKTEVPEGETGAVPEPSIDLTTSVEREATENKGLIGKLADLFSKDEKKVTEEAPVKYEEAVSESQSPMPIEVSPEKETVTELPEKVIEDDMTKGVEEVKEDIIAQSTAMAENVEKKGVFDKLVSLISSSEEKQEAVVTAEPTPQAEETSSPVDEVGKVDDKAAAVSETVLGDIKAAELEVVVTPDVAKESRVEESGLFAKLGNLFTTDKEGEKPAVEVEKEAVLSKAEEGVAVEDIPVSESVISDEVPTSASEEPVLEVKDKSLFSKLAELVSVTDKKPEEPTPAEQETVSEPSQETHPEQVPEAGGDQQPSLVSPEPETKPSLLDRVANIFSKDSEPASSGETQTTDQEIRSDSSKDVDNKTERDKDDQLLIVVSKPSSPVYTGDPEDGGQQTLQSSGWLQGSWFRSSVKQDGKDVIIQVGTETPEKDYGQSNPEDSDMYTTRS